jgi:Putative beta-lactamase-inhibitor-like, PepSY-like
MRTVLIELSSSKAKLSGEESTMRRQRMFWRIGFVPVLVLGLVLALALTTAALSSTTAQEEKIARSEVPEAVLAAIRARYPGAPLQQFVKETEDGKLSYEVALDWKGERTEVVVSPDGRILVEEVTIRIDDLPAAVRKGLVSSKYGSAKVTKVEKVTETDKAPTFEIVVDLGGEKHELVLAGNGDIQSDERLGTKPSEPPPLGVTPGFDFQS